MKLILGSGSKWRQQILREAGYTFDVQSPNIDEQSIRNKDPEQLVLALAHAKAAALLVDIHESAILITSDQVIEWNGTIREKPKNADDVHVFLESYVEHAPETVTSLVVTNTANRKTAEGIDRVQVLFSTVPDDVIAKLIQQNPCCQTASFLFRPKVHSNRKANWIFFNQGTFSLQHRLHSMDKSLHGYIID